jgi:hypothetical protein
VAQPFEVEAETHAVFLDCLVAYLRDDVVENRIGLTDVDDFHYSGVL